MSFCLLQGELGKLTICLNLWFVYFSPRGRHNHMLMKNISTCETRIRMRAVNHQQAQVNHLATKVLFKPQQRKKGQDFSFWIFGFSFCFGASFYQDLVDCLDHASPWSHRMGWPWTAMASKPGFKFGLANYSPQACCLNSLNIYFFLRRKICSPNLKKAQDVLNKSM